MSPEAAYRLEQGQYFTPAWAAEAIIERFFPRLGPGDLVLEPSCGEGAFLAALPTSVPAIGVELDPGLAALAAQRTGRTVLNGDFLNTPLPAGITAIVGNPPFKSALVERFLMRSHALLPDEGQAGFILPAYVLQTSSKVMRYNEHWAIRQELLPRNLFPRLKLPIVFSVFTKSRARTLVGFFLYAEAEDIRALTKQARATATAGGRGSRGSVWVAVVDQVLTTLGGEAALDQIYAAMERKRPTENRFWREKVRQILQETPRFQSVSKGRWRRCDAAHSDLRVAA